MSSEQFVQWVAGTRDRFPEGFVEHRLALEQKKRDRIRPRESHIIARIREPRAVISTALKLSGLAQRGARNTLDIEVINHRLEINGLGRAWGGAKLLQISDMHFAENSTLLPALLDAVKSLKYDLCVLTGDYRCRSFGPIEPCIRCMKQLIDTVNTDVVAILGNHDSIRKIPELESMGVTVLLNETCSVERGGATLHVVGVDDPHFYQTDNLKRALDSRYEHTQTTLLLAHSPELYVEASEAGVGAYLCGHTHGGQICLPGGIPILRNSRSPRWSWSGQWQFERMSGYTSRGVGSSIAQARFNCRPEITLHELVSMQAAKP